MVALCDGLMEWILWEAPTLLFPSEMKGVRGDLSRIFPTKIHSSEPLSLAPGSNPRAYEHNGPIFHRREIL